MKDRTITHPASKSYDNSFEYEEGNEIGIFIQGLFLGIVLGLFGVGMILGICALL